MIAGDNKRPRSPSGTTAAPPPDGLLEQILNRFVRSTFAINSKQEVLYQNTTAQKLIERKDLVKIHNRLIQFSDKALVKKVADYLCDPSRNQRTVMLRSLTAEHTTTNTVVYRVLLTPLYIGKQDIESQIWLLFVSESSIERRIEIEVLQQLYGLTRGESKLTSCLFAGNSLTSAAAILHISINTAKTLLRRVFQKSGVQSQTELLQLLALGPRSL